MFKGLLNSLSRPLKRILSADFYFAVAGALLAVAVEGDEVDDWHSGVLRLRWWLRLQHCSRCIARYGDPSEGWGGFCGNFLFP